MTKNIGRLDQVLRIGISIGLIYVSVIDEQFILDPLSSYIIAAIGVINMVFALIQYCPLYCFVDIDTRHNKNL